MLTGALTELERQRLIALLTKVVADDGPSAIHSVEHLVAQAHYRLRRLGDQRLAAYGLRTRHFALLPALDLFIEELVKAGIVSRGQDPHDRRRYALQLTDLGRGAALLRSGALAGLVHDRGCHLRGQAHRACLEGLLTAVGALIRPVLQPCRVGAQIPEGLRVQDE